MVNDKFCLISIKNNYHRLTRAQKKLADYICNNPEKVVGLTSAKISKEAGVSGATVTRLSTDLGFSGYSELKYALAAEISKNRQLNFMPNITPKDTSSDVLDKVFSASIKTLHDTAEHIDRVSLEKAADIIYNADAVYIYAVGTSAIIAEDFAYRLMQMGKKAYCYTDVVAMEVSTMNLTSKDVAVAISHSGRTAPVADTMSLASQTGASTLCITSFANSMLAETCDTVINVYSDEINYPTEAFCSRTAHLCVANALTVAVSLKNYDETQKRSQHTHSIVNNMRYES